MRLIRGFTDPAAYHGGFVTIGNFDGVHRGHQSMIAALVGHARRDNVPAVVLTLDPHPIELLRPEQAPPNLSTLQQKADLLQNCGVDCTIAYPTDLEFLQRSPEQFFQQTILGELQARGLVEGQNFCFGHNREGDIATLQALCDGADLLLDVIAPVKAGKKAISSSVIRARVAEGDVKQAAVLLGHRYLVQGTVSRGAQRGRTIGFPTANLEHVATLLPPEGVYAGYGRIEDRFYPAAVHIGANPTFDDQRFKLEAHLIGFEGNLYDQKLDVEFIERIRDVHRFDDVDALRQQLQEDVEKVLAMVQAEPAR
jgi:riboflavin kinase/FMN adenylyltransferase